MDEIKEFLSALASDGIDPPEREVVEALWLAAHMHSAAKDIQGDSRSDPRVGIAAGSDVTSALGIEPVGQSGRPREILGASVPIWHGESRFAARQGKDELPIRLPVQRELRRPLDLQRALRPFGRSMPSRSRVVLDEQATAEFSADAGSLFPLFRAGAERWFRLALVIDASQSMILWSQLATELRETLEQTGAFGSVRTWYLDGDSPEAVIGSADGSGALHSPREVVDPTGRQVVLVLSDCVGEAWRTDSALRALGLWGRSGPTAIVQPLPQELWGRSPVGCHHVQLGAAPGLPNHRLAVWWDDLLPAEERPSGVPVPVLEVEPEWFANWAGLITGSLRRAHLIAAFTGEQPVLAEEAVADRFGVPGPRRAVERFMSSASPEAFRLAGFPPGGGVSQRTAPHDSGLRGRKGVRIHPRGA